MKNFVNREIEMRMIEEAVDALLSSQSLLRTPIIQFYGVEGIGKTALLRKVEQRCQARFLPYIWMEGGQSLSRQFQEAWGRLKEKAPAVVICDSLDTASKEQLQQMEEELNDLLRNSKLFIVLAGRRAEKFDNTRSIVRKLTLFALQPLKREDCLTYLQSFESTTVSEISDIIFEWTRGYPLAMDVMVESILDRALDPRNKHDQKLLLSAIVEKVITNQVLSKVSSSDLLWYQTILGLLSVPRRFNVIIIQDIIERYAPDYKLENSLAYITLPNKINQPTDVLHWNQVRAAYSIDAPVRNVLLLKLKVENRQRYFSIHRFLAEINEQFAEEVSDISSQDQVRYLREFFYHIAMSETTEDIPAIFARHIEQIIEKQSSEVFLQLAEEFLRDEELQEALGESTETIQALIKKQQEQIEKHLQVKKLDMA